MANGADRLFIQEVKSALIFYLVIYFFTLTAEHILCVTGSLITIPLSSAILALHTTLVWFYSSQLPCFGAFSSLRV